MYPANKTMKIKFDKQKISIAVLALFGILLIAYSGQVKSASDTNVGQTQQYTDVGFYTGYLEERIGELCRSIEGIQEANVFLTLDCSSEYVYSDDSASDFLILSGSDGEQAVMLCEIYPRVRGVAVVCTGGDLPRIRETVTELLSASLGLPFNKIKVAGS